MNFADFKVENKANTRVGSTAPRGQNFDFKFRSFVSKKNKQVKDETQFVFAEKKFQALGLDSNGLLQITAPDGKTYLAVVKNDDATLVRKTERTAKDGSDSKKGRSFKSTILEEALQLMGLIDVKLQGKNQKLSLDKVEGSEGATLPKGVIAVAVYAVSKDNREDNEDDAEESDESTENTEENGNGEKGNPTEIPSIPAPQVQTPQPNPAPVAASNDDF